MIRGNFADVLLKVRWGRKGGKSSLPRIGIGTLLSLEALGMLVGRYLSEEDVTAAYANFL